MKTVFIAAPISGFKSNDDYTVFRKSVMELILELKKEHKVLSELESISELADYDSPQTSVIEDTLKIRASDWFILIHPQRMQTSSLIELGNAYAMGKK